MANERNAGSDDGFDLRQNLSSAFGFHVFCAGSYQPLRIGERGFGQAWIESKRSVEVVERPI